jgi:phosphoglycolate phosphatase
MIDYVAARTSHDPNLLKPSPYLLNQAIVALGVVPTDCVLVGDSVTDMQAAQLAGVLRVGYANKLGKSADLSRAGAQDVITSWPRL